MKLFLGWLAVGIALGASALVFSRVFEGWQAKDGGLGEVAAEFTAYGLVGWLLWGGILIYGGLMHLGIIPGKKTPLSQFTRFKDKYGAHNLHAQVVSKSTEPTLPRTPKTKSGGESSGHVVARWIVCGGLLVWAVVIGLFLLFPDPPRNGDTPVAPELVSEDETEQDALGADARMQQADLASWLISLEETSDPGFTRWSAVSRGGEFKIEMSHPPDWHATQSKRSGAIQEFHGGDLTATVIVKDSHPAEPDEGRDQIGSGFASVAGNRVSWIEYRFVTRPDGIQSHGLIFEFSHAGRVVALDFEAVSVPRLDGIDARDRFISGGPLVAKMLKTLRIESR